MRECQSSRHVLLLCMCGDTLISSASIPTHMHTRKPPLLPQSDLCLLGLVHGYFTGRLPSRLAVLPKLGQGTDTALKEPASLLGTKQLLLLDQSRGSDLRSHLAHEARSWNYAKGRGWEFGCLAPTPVLPHQGTFKVQGPQMSPGPYGTINSD